MGMKCVMKWLFCIGYEMGSLIRTNLKTFFLSNDEYVMKFMPFE